MPTDTNYELERAVKMFRDSKRAELKMIMLDAQLLGAVSRIPANLKEEYVKRTTKCEEDFDEASEKAEEGKVSRIKKYY